MSADTQWALDLQMPDLTGFRLWNAELYNWGTFDRSVVKFPVHGNDTFVTGQVGAGKSTVVDALTTLFVQPHRVVYNQAAGAERKERSLDTYLKGTYAAEADDMNANGKPVSLRGTSHVSVILAHFRDDLSRTDVTFAQVFYFTAKGAPEKVYLTADAAVTIDDLLTGAGKTVKQLKAHLRKHMHECDGWSDYITRVRKRLGLRHEKALTLWATTVSMKQVGSLTAFVRTHMLEPPDETRLKIANLVDHYQDLTAAYDAIQVAKAKIAILTPMMADLDARDEGVAEEQEWIEIRDEHLAPFYQALTIDAITNATVDVEAKLDEARGKRKAADQRMTSTQTQIATIEQAIRESGGEALQTLDRQIDAADTVLKERRERYATYADRCHTLGVEPAVTVEQFTGLRTRLERMHAEAEAALSDRAAMALYSERSNVQARLKDIRDDVANLKRRKSNIDTRLLRVRTMIADAVGVDEADLPFAGELIQVRPDHREWEPAIQRLLGGFGSSMLVPDALYPQVMRYVDRTNLRSRLVYYRIARDLRGPVRRVTPGTVPHAVDILPTSPMADWLTNELGRRFDYLLADEKTFRDADLAITKSGQIKQRQRHEKDDRSPLGDKSQYVLGWDNLGKIAALEEQIADLVAEETRLTAAFEAADDAHKRSQATMNNTDTLLREYADFVSVDVASAVDAVNGLKAQWERLRADSTDLDALYASLEDAKEQYDRHKTRYDGLGERIGGLQSQWQDLAERRETLPETPATVPDHVHAQLTGLHASAVQTLGVQVTVKNIDRVEQAVRATVQDRIKSRRDKISAAEQHATVSMQKFISAYREEAADADATIESADEFRAIHSRLTTDDLPRFEDAFRSQLSDNAIREMAGFNRHLNDAADRIGDHIERINKSLVDIDFKPGTFIRLETTRSLDTQIRDFRRELRDCIEGSLGSTDDAFTEERFHRVKAIMERFKGRPGQTEDDRRWTMKVTDVNNWYTFAIVERERVSGEQVGYYSDSSAKSGGEKEKLAYTILAAALSYNFGLVAGDPRSRTFRFIVIDEAFAKGSEESTGFALSLFNKMGLQVMVVTPLQKKEVIVRYVARVGLVVKGPDSRSHLMFMTVDKYQDYAAAASKAARDALQDRVL